ncbi:MAG TPA: twin-arginine translocation signal domain-containing protein [Campylobacterales bacterium]|nr:twin-arginine translocation signal domain-containing protein [Campylobacterales bacterium]HHH51678.1 twin-arginine translocation signal domain-containing protein [Campylobacterales bacterium]
MKRRDFLKTAVVTAGTVGLGTTIVEAGVTHQPIDNKKISTETFPEKRPVITY